MRQEILALKSIGGYPLIEKNLKKDDLKKVEAAFITSAILEICPVSRIENQELSLKNSEAIREEWLQIKRSKIQQRLL